MALSESVERLAEVIRTLLGPQGCPWDREQTPESLCDYLIEETYELVEAIRNGDADGAREEVGDVLFLLFFVSELYAADSHFTAEEAVEYARAKMVRRHPHVFGDTHFTDQQELMRTWERIKRSEKKQTEGPERAFASLPAALPPLIRAYRINSKAARLGFTWDTDANQERQLEAEWEEWREALESGDAERQRDEYGDYLFSLVEYGRRRGIKANEALDFANRKFLRRYERMEDLARERGLDLDELDMQAKDELWAEAKRLLAAE